MKKFQFVFFLFICVIGVPQDAFSQDSLRANAFIPRKNVIRYNLTPNILGFKSAIFGYERVLKPYQSISINAGYIATGNTGREENEDIKVIGTRKSNGFTIAGDYRFYMKRENLDPAPHGIYIAPFFSMYKLTHQNQIQPSQSIDPNEISFVDTKFSMTNLGLELGYQFNIKNRISIDLVLFGPSISSYKLNMKYSGGYLPLNGISDEDLIALRDYSISKYPWLKTLVDEGKFDLKGTKAVWGMGFRYVIQVGYRF